MRAPAWLKPENGPVGSALGGWLDFAPSGIATRFFLLWFVILYTAFQVLSFASLGLNPDLLELYAWGLHPALGYYKHPPLAALVVGGWFAAFPPTDWAFYLLAMANSALGLYATSLIARRYLAGDKRIVVLLLLLLTPFYQFHGVRFNANAILLSMWPIATYCFLRAFETRALAWSAAAGATAALAMLGKYYSIFLIAGLVAAAVASPARVAYLRSPAPWISAVVGAIVLAPHVMWLDANGFAPFSYATALHAGASLGDVLAGDAKYVAGGLGYVAVPLAVYWLAVRPDRATLRETLWPADATGRMLVILLAVPLVLPALVALFIGAVLTPLWTMPAWFLLPIVLLRPDGATFSRAAAIRLTVLVVAITLGALIAAPFLARHYHDAGTKESREYFRQVASEVTNAWHLGTGSPLRIVMGDYNLVLATTFYSPDHPDSVPRFDLISAPWVTPARLERDGWTAICMADDEDCVGEARRRTADKANVRIVTFSTLSRYGDRPGKLGRFMFVLVPPQETPRPLTR
jgi:4-amino-4-deoxy-L-arabinose transferase-like glycosyltransferase